MNLRDGISALLIAGAFTLPHATLRAAEPPSLSPTNAVEKRVENLLSRMTEPEKISLLAGDPVDGMSTMAIPRLGIAKMVMADGPQGIRAHGPACSFPSGIALAATWDPALAFAYGAALGREARARGIQIQLGPGVNIARTPLNGRNFEYFGEDPFLTSVMATQWIRGLQSEGVAATVKHFVGNDTEWRRMEIESVMNEQTLREIYLRPFEDTVKQGGVWSVMSAYNRLNGFPSTGNDRLQNGILKGEWGFRGPVMSDWWATQSIDAIAKGLDLEMPMAYRVTPDSIAKALAGGSLTRPQIDEAVRRILRMAVSMGFAEGKPSTSDLPLDSQENNALALDVATKSIVLLKNSGPTLPLDRNALRKVVVYGPNAQDTPAVGGGSGGVVPFRKVSFLEGIRRELPDADVFYSPMPLSPPFSLSGFFELGKQITLPAQISDIRRMVCVSKNGMTKVTTSTPRSISLAWTRKSLPEGIERNEEGRVVWDAVIEAETAGNFELLSIGHPEIRLGNRELGNPESYVLALAKRERLPLRVTANEVGRSSGNVSVTIRPVPEGESGIVPAGRADAAIVCVGQNPDVEGEGYDRGFVLPVSQQQLIRKVAAANPCTIVVLSGGAAVDMKPWIDSVPAVLQTWYLGQSAGTALASVLLGEAGPTGRLPCTFDRSIEENPAYRHYPGDYTEGKDWPVADYHEGIFYGYRGYDRSGKDPLFPFGYGLSYTSFELDIASLRRNADGAEISVMLTNTGKRKGSTVIQAYLSLTKESTERPLRELKGFQRVELQPGEHRTVTLQISDESLRYWHPVENAWHSPEGPVQIDLGFSERDIRRQVILPSQLQTNSALPGGIRNSVAAPSSTPVL
jgi:beta-glucosidase